MQNLTVIGNLGADAEVRDVNGKKFVSFKVADTTKFINQKGETTEKTTWVSCAMNGDGGSVLQYLRKGTKVCVIGRPSYKVFSSQKERCMMAGVDLHVLNIELCGGGSDDAVPRELCTPEGLIVRPRKLFWIEQPSENPFSVLMSTRGNGRFVVDADGFITPDNNQSSEDNAES